MAKLQILEAISTIRKNRKRPDGKTIQEYANHSSAGNINESFAIDNLRVLVDQNIILNKPRSSGDLYYIVESNSSDKCIISVDCDTPLNVMLFVRTCKGTMAKAQIMHIQKISR